MAARLYGLVLALILAPAIARAAEPPPPNPDADKAAQALAETCAKMLCRKTPWTFTLQMVNGDSFESAAQPYPYLDEHGELILFPGETLELATANQAGNLTPPVLSRITDPTGTVDVGGGTPALSFAFRQGPGGKAGMMLTVTNTLDATIKYDARMFVPTAQGMRTMKTTACPVLPPQGSSKTFSGIETWPQPIAMMVISNIQILPKDAPKLCN